MRPPVAAKRAVSINTRRVRRMRAVRSDATRSAGARLLSITRRIEQQLKGTAWHDKCE